jgi:hypothetical protein
MASADIVTAALQPLPAGYQELAASVIWCAEEDDRIRALWLSGSVGRGVADAGSDLDVALGLAPDAFDDFAGTWRDWLARVTPVLFARGLPRLPGSFYSVTSGCLRLDVVAERAGTASAGSRARRLLVLDKDGAERAAANAGDGMPAEELRGPDPARLTDLTLEFLRQGAIFPAAVVARQDWLLGVAGVQGIQQLLYELFVESNQPLPPMGVKQWSAKLTPEQRDVRAGLPPPVATPEGVLAAMRAAAAACRRAARSILAAHGVPWPQEFDQAVLRYWESDLGWTDGTASS